MSFLKRFPLVGIIGIFLFGAALVVWINDSEDAERKRENCQTALDITLAIRDILDLSGGTRADLPPERQLLTQKIYARLEVPPRVCEGTGIDIEDFFERDTGITTTTTTTPVVEGTSAPTLAPQTVQVGDVQVTISRTPDRIERAPPRPSPPPTTTTTSTSSTTTTTAPGVYLPPITIPWPLNISWSLIL